MAGLPSFISGFKELHATLLATTDAGRRLACLRELGGSASRLAGTAGAVGCPMIARLTEAYNALFQELHDRPASISASTVRTSVQALELLEKLTLCADRLPDLDDYQPRALIVEDDAISLRAAKHSLQLASLPAVAESHGETALNTAARHNFDIFLLDIDIIGMSGPELCSRLRAMPQYADAPIIFVTTRHDYAGRIQSDLGGATDFISKPYPSVELSLKSVIFLFRTLLAKSGLL